MLSGRGPRTCRRIGAALVGLLLASGSAVAGELAPDAVTPAGPAEIVPQGRFSARTLSLAIEIDRDAAHIVAYTLKARPFVRPLATPPPRPHREGQPVQIEITLLGALGERYTQRLDAGRLCFLHGPDAPPHVLGDTILLHRDRVVVEVPDREGFDRVDFAWYEAGDGGAFERRSLGVDRLDPSQFTPAGGPFSYSDLAIATSSAAPSADSQLTPGTVHWPEEYGDADIYKFFGNPAETDRRINVVLVPDGYRYSEKALMESHAQALVAHFRAKSPYSEHDPFLNYILVYAYSTDSGTDQCDCGVVKDTAMSSRFPNAGYPCGDSGNRCLYYGWGCDVDTSAHIAQAELRAPADDVTVVMVNTSRYGGCGGVRAVYAAGNGSATEIAVHELGHALAGLADEYVTYLECGHAAGEINTSVDGTKGAWPEWIDEIGPPREGAEYYQQCVYRAQDYCDMQYLGQDFCTVCKQRFSLVFFGHWRVSPTAPIASQSPPSPATVESGVPASFSVATRLPQGTAIANAITWRLQGPGYPTPTVVATDVENLQYTFATDGDYTLTCEVIANTTYIRPAKYGANVDTATWNVTVTLARPGEVSPPGSAHPLVFTDRTTLEWAAAAENGAATFNVYRGAVLGLPAGEYGACLQQDLSANTTTDGEEPPASVAWTYLITGKNAAGEGPLGNDSSGAPRANRSPCP